MTSRSLAALACSVAFAGLCASPAAQAGTPATYTETQLYSFTDTNGDGFSPSGLLTPGKNGVYFGATQGGATCGGNVFELLPDHTGGYTETPIFEFDCFGKGGSPSEPPIVDGKGNLYGAALIGGSSGNGIVYELKRRRTGGYKEIILYNFTGGSDGYYPSGLIADATGNLYGITYYGGASCGCGTVFKLTPGVSGYAYSTLYTFQGGSDGSQPNPGLHIGSDGSIYGTTFVGGPAGVGTVFQLSPNGNGYSETVLYGFQGGADGKWAESGLIADSSGALYGTTGYGGKDGQGAVYKIVPTGQNSTETVLYSFRGGSDGIEANNVIMDAKGNLYGTTAQGGRNQCSGLDGCGTVFKLKLESSGEYRHEVLYLFQTQPDGNTPNGVMFGKHGSLLGTTLYGGSDLSCLPDDGGCGTVFELTH